MAANTSPIFTLTASNPTAAIAAANTASDGSGTLVTLLTAGANGSRVDAITFLNAQITPAASSAMQVHAFVTDTGGINPRHLAEALLPAATRSATVLGATVTIVFNPPLVIGSGQIVKVTQSVYAGAADLTHVYARAGDF